MGTFLYKFDIALPTIQLSEEFVNGFTDSLGFDDPLQSGFEEEALGSVLPVKAKDPSFDLVPWQKILFHRQFGPDESASYNTNRPHAGSSLWVPAPLGPPPSTNDTPDIHALPRGRGPQGAGRGRSRRVTEEEREQQKIAVEHFKLLLNLILPHLNWGDATLTRALQIVEEKLSHPQAHTHYRVITICQSLVELVQKDARIKALDDYPKLKKLALSAWGPINPKRSRRFKISAVHNVLGVDNIPLHRFSDMSWEEICAAFDFEDREYQGGWFETLSARVAKGEDRAILAAPYQVGKTSSAVLLAIAISAAFPERFKGKSIMAIAPHTKVVDDMRSDISACGLDIKVGVIDADHKDLGAGYDVVVVSAMTLGRDDNLQFIDPENYGVVVVDEAPFVYGEYGTKLLQKLGFLDEETARPIQRPEGFLLGATADPFTLEKVFGKKARIEDYPFGWFVNEGYLHNPVGRLVRYDESREIDEIDEFGEKIIVPRLGKLFVDDVYQVYKRLFDGQKVMINCANITYAELVASFFNYMEGDGFAYANHSRQPMSQNRAMEAAFVTADGPKVMVGVARLAVGFRAKGAVAVINTYLTNFLRRYGQRLGRILGIHFGEEQQDKYVIDMVPSGYGTRSAKGVTLPTLIGLGDDYAGDEIDYRPFQGKIKAKGSRTEVTYDPSFKAISGKGGHLEFVPTEGGEARFVYPTRFPALLTRLLNGRFEGDLGAMATAAEMDRDELHQYLCGRLPQYQVLTRLAAHAEDPVALEHAWEEDGLELLSALHPLDARHSHEAIEPLVVLVRRSSLRFTYATGNIQPPQGRKLNKREATMLEAVVQGRMFHPKGPFYATKIFPEKFEMLSAASPEDEETIEAIIGRALDHERAIREELQGGEEQAVEAEARSDEHEEEGEQSTREEEPPAREEEPPAREEEEPPAREDPIETRRREAQRLREERERQRAAAVTSFIDDLRQRLIAREHRDSASRHSIRIALINLDRNLDHNQVRDYYTDEEDYLYETALAEVLTELERTRPQIFEDEALLTEILTLLIAEHILNDLERFPNYEYEHSTIVSILNRRIEERLETIPKPNPVVRTTTPVRSLLVGLAIALGIRAPNSRQLTTTQQENPSEAEKAPEKGLRYYLGWFRRFFG